MNLPTAPLPIDRLERVCAWGGTASALSYVWRPTTAGEIHQVFELARAHGVTIGLRGAGQSYGDAALNTEQICVDLSRMRRIVAWDPVRGVITGEPGVTIGDVWRHTVGDGWWPPVVTGTMEVSLGGAAAMNVHGKNNWRLGPIGEHIVTAELLLPTGERLRVSPTEHAELFHAAIGGFGMLGCFTSLTLQLKRVHSGLLDVEPLRLPDIDRMLASMAERMDTADYLVGWIDCFGRGRTLGRGLVHAGRYLAASDDPEPDRTLGLAAQELPTSIAGLLPRRHVWRLMRPLVNAPGMRLVNAAKYLLSERPHRQSHAQFHFLLDFVPGWKRAYGPGGLMQYQSFMPAGTAARTFAAQIELAQRHGVVPLLGVLKRHRTDGFLMTHGVDGYSLALDFRVTARNRDRVWDLARQMHDLVVAGGGRFYPAKDSTLDAAHYAQAIGADRLARFLALKRTYDPDGLLATDLARRLLGLTR